MEHGRPSLGGKACAQVAWEAASARTDARQRDCAYVLGTLCRQSSVEIGAGREP